LELGREPSSYSRKPLWLLLLLGILVSFLVIFSKFFPSKRQNIKRPNQEPTDHRKPDQGNDQPQQPVTMIAHLQIPDEDKRESRTYQQRNFRLQLALTVGTWLAFSAAAYYAHVAKQQWQVMQRQFELARMQQRSLIQVNLDAMLKLTADTFKEFAIPVTLENLGNFTASKIVLRGRIEIPEAVQEPSFDLERAFSATGNPIVHGGKGTIEIWAGDETGAVRKVPESLRNELKSGKRYLVIVVRVEYEDSVGTWWTQFCNFRVLTPPTITVPAIAARRCIDYSSEGGALKNQ